MKWNIATQYHENADTWTASASNVTRRGMPIRERQSFSATDIDMPSAVTRVLAEIISRDASATVSLECSAEVLDNVLSCR